MSHRIGVWNCFAALLGCVLGCAAVTASPADELEVGFRQLPSDARPWVYWVFMDGNMTREGMTADLEAMKQTGIDRVHHRYRRTA
jgi:hypothetical protein